MSAKNKGLTERRDVRVTPAEIEALKTWGEQWVVDGWISGKKGQRQLFESEMWRALIQVCVMGKSEPEF